MKKFEDDKILKGLMRGIRLEKPGADFTTNVMNRVFEIKAATVQVARLNILDWKFWVLVTLFVALAIVMMILSQSGAQPENTLLPSLDSSKARQEYYSILDSFNKAPLSIAAILTASSLLIFIERFVARKKHA